MPVAGCSRAGGPAGDPATGSGGIPWGHQGPPRASTTAGRTAVNGQLAASMVQHAWLTRRAVIAASAALAGAFLSACRGVQVLGTPPALPADVRQLQAAIAAERTLIADYQSAVSRARAVDPAVMTALSGLLAEHQQHLVQLSARLVVPAGASQAASRAGAVPHLAADLQATLGSLAEAESAAAQRLASQLLTVPPSLAQLMASISASEATHVGALTTLRRRVR
jgi:hypothetical protein